MSNSEQNFLNKRVKLPLLVRCVIFCYLCGYGMADYAGVIDSEGDFRDVMKLVILAMFAGGFSYGFIMIIKHFKQGGIKRILKEIEDFTNGDF